MYEPVDAAWQQRFREGRRRKWEKGFEVLPPAISICPVPISSLDERIQKPMRLAKNIHAFPNLRILNLCRRINEKNKVRQMPIREVNDINEYRIHPLMVGVMGSLKGATTHLLDMMTPVAGPALVFYLEGGPQKILVDTGVGGPEGVVRALNGIGLKPEDIDTVILTHLHFDHADNVGLFPQARFILQKKEWEYAKSPLPIQCSLYNPQTLSELEHLNLILVGDGYEVEDGVEVILVPGHTKGQQAVVVNTSQGKYVLAGDLLYCWLNIYPGITEYTDMMGNKITCTPQSEHAFYPPGIHTDLSDWYDSVWKVLSFAGSRKRLVPGHEPGLVGKIIPQE